MKSFLYSGLMLLLLSCEVRQPEERRVSPPAEVKPPTPPPPITTPPPEQPKPKVTPGIPEGDLGKAMAYSLPNASILFVIDVKRLASSTILAPLLAQLNTLMGSSSPWKEVLSVGFDPLRDLHGVVLSMRQPVGASAETVLALVGSFDAPAIAKKLEESPSRGDEEAVSVAPNLLLVGKASLLAEAKLAAERGVLVDAPLMLAALSGLDITRPVFGAFFPPATSRASAHGSERAKLVTVEFDPSKDLYLKTLFHFDTPKEAEDAKVELDDGLKQMGPMVGMLGVPDPSALVKAFTIKTDGTQLTFLLALDSATATSLVTGVVRFSGGLK